jgi:hypothetical protein
MSACFKPLSNDGIASSLLKPFRLFDCRRGGHDFRAGVVGRPPQERPFLILVVGYPAKSATVPAIAKRPFEDIATFI